MTNTNHTVEYLSVGTHIIRVTFISDDDNDYYSKQFTITVKPWTPSGNGTNSSEITPSKPNQDQQQTQSTKVNPKKTTITASKKTFKSKVKVKKYTVTLKSGTKKISKVWVYLTIKGKKYKKTFNARTNTKGKATFKITKLTKKGKYTATITFKGNSKYKKLTKKVKISIK